MIVDVYIIFCKNIDSACTKTLKFLIRVTFDKNCSIIIYLLKVTFALSILTYA